MQFNSFILLPFSFLIFFLSWPEQLNRWPCHWLTQYFYFWHSKSDPGDLWHLNDEKTWPDQHFDNLDFFTIFYIFYTFKKMKFFENLWTFWEFWFTIFVNLTIFSVVFRSPSPYRVGKGFWCIFVRPYELCSIFTTASCIWLIKTSSQASELR